MKGFITPIDVASRLLRFHQIWFHGKPKVSLEGEDRQFGKLCFDFGDEVVRYGIYSFRRRKPLPFYKIEWLVAKRASVANECDQPFRVVG